MNSRPVFELLVGRQKIRLGERTIIMGVVNVTPDSFSDAGLYLDPRSAIRHGVELVRQGADWIDVGGESTRPGSLPISVEEELRRVLPVICGLRRRLPFVPISIDTTKADVAERAVGAGANILNDVSGLRFDSRVAEVARRHRTPLILMHMRGRPETMQQKPFAREVWRSLRSDLALSIRRALDAGVCRSQLILDPGLGFGKSRRQNFEILASLAKLQRVRLPILVGTSRKSFVQAVASGEELAASSSQSRARRKSAALWPLLPSRRNQPAVSMELVLGDAAAVVASILAGAHVVRVHDVASVLPAVRIADAVLTARRKPR